MATTSGRGKGGKRGGASIRDTIAVGAGRTAPLVEAATRLPPGVFFKPDPVENLFTTARAGRPVVRPDDLLALRVQLINLTVLPGSPPRVQRSGTAAAYLVLHFPPQSIAEEVFYEAPPAGTSDSNPDKPPPAPGQPAPQPPGDNNVDPPPVRARAAGESRVVFEWPSGFEADYTVAGLLDAVQQLAMKVPRGARPRQASLPVFPWWPGALLTQELERVSARRVLTSSRTLALGSTSLRQASIALRGGPAAEATLTRRLLDVSPGLAVGGTIDLGRILFPLGEPEPAPPTDTETALELPWRLIVSPHAGERWRHAAQAVTSTATKRTELWHSRLVGSDAS
ncbi:MAG: hypothetical protein QFE16_14400, partial [Pseudomonadota bacterium]|nr:hypothetical protein [Pseudomonadota bacterium]